MKRQIQKWDLNVPIFKINGSVEGKTDRKTLVFPLNMRMPGRFVFQFWDKMCQNKSVHVYVYIYMIVGCRLNSHHAAESEISRKKSTQHCAHAHSHNAVLLCAAAPIRASSSSSSSTSTNARKSSNHKQTHKHKHKRKEVKNLHEEKNSIGELSQPWK